MWIKRELENQLNQDQESYIQIVAGPRQCGKSSILAFISGNEFRELTFDDLQLRTLANSDPKLFLEQYGYNVIIDEAQYAPNIFPELKRIVDELKRQQLLSTSPDIKKPIFRLTGSNQILMQREVQESLVGRASYYYLNTMSVSEIKNAFPNESIYNILFCGGWPEIYSNRNIGIVKYLNDYISTYLDKDIIQSAGITKRYEFHTVLGLLAARTGELLDYTAVANSSNVKSVTVKEWVSVLETSSLVYLLKPYSSNLNKRLIKTPKLYFLDTGLAVRLQGWQEQEPFIKSPQVGHMFETLVLAEIIKYKINHDKSWNIFLWRTKDGKEIDFILENAKGEILPIDAKMGIQSVSAKTLPDVFLRDFSRAKQLLLVSPGGDKVQLNKSCLQIPITDLKEFLDDFS